MTETLVTNAFRDPLQRHAKARPNDDALVSSTQRLSWSELAQAVDSTAATLVAQGLQAGDCVATTTPDSIEGLIADLAVLAADGIHAPVDPHAGFDDQSALLQRLRPQWVQSEPGVLQPGSDQPWRCPAANAAFLRFSSGTTGTAKGVLLQHQAIRERCAIANTALGYSPQTRLAWSLPIAYHFAVSIGTVLEAGACLIFVPGLRGKKMAQFIHQQQCTHAYMAPWHIQRLNSVKNREELPVSLSEIVVTTAALGDDTARTFRETFPHIRLRQALGIIECGLPFISPGKPQEAAGFLGQPLAGFTASIRNEQGNECATQEAGSLHIHGNGAFTAYTDPWQAYADCCPGGYFDTGDIAQRYADGSIQLLGRKKQVINVAGMKIFPLQVETVFNDHPAVRACLVFAEADSRTGERVVARVEADDSEQLVSELQALAEQRLSQLAQPARIEIVDKLEKTGSGKPKAF